jgi:hypothetical protein
LDFESLEKDLTETIKRRILSRIDLDLFKLLEIDNFYIAGNSLNESTPNDIDIYPVGEAFSYDYFVHCLKKKELSGAKIVSNTKNATTLRYKETIYQFYKYKKNSLKELVESFDFAHIKIGVFFKKDYVTNYSIKEVYISDDYIRARLFKNSFYTGSEYPLSSLLRINKYIARDEFLGKSYYTDIQEVDGNVAFDLFKKLAKAGLVENDRR